jgi:non-specific serine/threonine protein kinase
LLAVFPNGVWLIELAPLTDPTLVPQTVAAVLGLKEEAGRALLSTLTDHVHGKKILLLLDNCEHLIKACAQLAEALLHACPNVYILATSREVLGVAGEISFLVPSLLSPDPAQAIQVDTLSNYESVQLFMDRAMTSMPGFAATNDNAGAIAQVCHRLDGIPLAIELAAARIKLLRVEQIAERLGDRFQLLTGGGRTALPRHQTLAALIDWSHDLLTEAERILLRRLSVFAGGWMLEAAEAVCVGDGIEQSHVLDLLTQLVNKSLVLAERAQGEEARYHILETIREYAMEKLTASGEADTVRRRHARYYLSGAEAGLFDPKFAHLEQKYDDLRTALAWCLSATGDIELGLRLAASMSVEMFPAEAIRWLERALTRAEIADVDMTYARADALGALGTHLALQGNYVSAQDQMAHSLKLFKKLGNKERIGWTLWRLGWLARERGDAVTARVKLEESIALYRELDDKEAVAWGLVTLGEVAVLDEDTEWAIPILEEGLALMQEYKHLFGAAWAFNHLGHIAQVRGEYARATRLHDESMLLFRQVGAETLGPIWGLQSLGETALAEGKSALASDHFIHALEISRSGGFRAETAWCLAGLAGVAALDEEPERAAWLWGAAEALRKLIGTREAPASHATHERLKNQVRKQLGEAAFQAKWAEGQAASIEQAIAEALA